MKARRIFWTVLMLTLLIGGTAFYLTPRLIQATPLSNASGEPRNLSDLVNFTKISNVRETTLTPLSNDWENALAAIQQYPGTAQIYSEACSKYSCPGGIPLTLSGSPQTLLPQKSAAATNDYFGYSVTGVGPNILIGVFNNATAGLTGAGAAYMFDINGNLLATFHEPTPAANDNFGWAVASVDGRVLISSPYTNVTGQASAGAAYLFDTSGNLLMTYHEPSPAVSDLFGYSVASVGASVLVGSPYSLVSGQARAGAAYLFDTSGNLLMTYHEPSPASQDYFGWSVGSAGGNVLVSAPFTTVAGLTRAGAAYLFDTTYGSLLTTFHEPNPAASDRFGLALGGLAGNVLVGSPYRSNGGTAYLFDVTGKLAVTLTAPGGTTQDAFGISVSTLGNNILIGSTATFGGLAYAGAAYLFDISGNPLVTFHEPNPAANDEFGLSLASVGSNVLVGSPFTTVQGFIPGTAIPGTFLQAGQAYLFDSAGNLVRSLQKPNRPANGLFGYSVSATGNNIIVGSAGSTTPQGAGIAYVLDSSGTILRTLQVNGAGFGYSVAGVGPDFLVGAPGTYNSNGNIGAAYLFDSSGNLIATLRNPHSNSNSYFGYSVAAIGTNMIIGAPDNSTSGLTYSGAAYLFDSGGNLLASFHEPTPGAFSLFGWSVAAVGTNILVGSSGSTVNGIVSAGAAYLFDSKGNLLRTYHEPTPGNSNNFGSSVAGVGGNSLIGSPHSTAGGKGSAGATYLFDSSGNLLTSYHEPFPDTNDYFGLSLAAVGGSVLIGAPGPLAGGLPAPTNAGAAYLFDIKGNLLNTFHEPAPAIGDNFGTSVAGIGSNVLIGSPSTSPGGFLKSGAAYYYRQFGLRDACAASTGSDCTVVSETGSFQAGTSIVSMNAFAVSLRSALNTTLGTQMALTILCNTEVTDPSLECSAIYVDGNVWGPARDALKGPFIIVNAEPYFYLQWHWWDPYNQRIATWSYWWYGTNSSPNWYWSIYLWWRTYVGSNLGVWTPWWWWTWSWMYWRYWGWWGTSFQNVS